MKILILTIVACFSVLFTVAQKHTAEIQQRVRTISETFLVDSTHASKIALALDYNVDRIRAVLSDVKLYSSAKLDLVRKLEAEREASIRRVLTPAQYAKLEAIRNQVVSERQAAGEKYREEQLRKIRQKVRQP